MLKTKILFSVAVLLVFAGADLAKPRQAAPQGQAQETAAAKTKAAGIARTAAGTPIPGATVRITHLVSGQAWVSWTDENGKFELPGVPAGRYRIEAQQIGFANASKEIELAAEKPAEIELIFQVAAPAPATPATPEKAEGATQKTEPSTGEPKPAAAEKPAQPQAATKPAGPAPGGQPARPPQGQRPTQQQQQQMADALRQRLGGGGFQQVDPTGQQGGANAPNGEAASDLSAQALGPLGEASSSDAFLMNGTVSRGATAGGGFNFAPFMSAFGMGMFPEGAMGGMGAMGGEGFPGQGGGFPGQGGGPGQVMIFMGGGPGGPGGAQQGQRGARPGQGQNQGQRQGQQGQGQQAQGQQGAQGQQRQGGGEGPGEVTVRMGPGGFGEATGSMMGLQRIMRQQVNRLRFGLYERYGNSALDARPYSLTAANPAKIDSYRERWGVNLGGPVVLGKLYNGKDKTFFFVNYDMGRDLSPVDTFATVPLPAERTGDFTARGVQLFDPNSNLTGPRTSLGSVIPSTMLDSAAVGLLPFIPLPNLPGTVQNFHLQATVPQHTDRVNVRIVHTINQRFSLQSNYNASSTRQRSVQSFPELGGRASILGQTFALGLSQQYSQRLAHDTRLNFTRNRADNLNRFAFVNDIAGNLGITGISTAPVNFGVPQIGFTNFTGLNDPVPAFRRNQTLRFMDNVSYTLKKHSLRAGGEIRRMQINTRNDPVARGSFTFSGLMTSQLDAQGQPIPGTGLDFGDFLLGLPQATNVRFGSSSTYFRSWGFAGYVQDDWRIHPRFSLNLGLRYEATTPPIELFNHIANLDVNSGITDVATVVPGQLAPFSGDVGRALIRGDYNNWGPRVSIAWRPKEFLGKGHTMTVRAGYSVLYNASIYNQLSASLANQPPWAQAQTRLTSATRVLTLTNGFPLEPPGTVQNTVAVDPNYRVGYAQLWNLSVETLVHRNVTVDLTYTGTKGTRLDLFRSPNRALPGGPLGTELNRRIPNAPGFTYDQSLANSIYHALQVRVQRRFVRGFMLMGLYTYGKSIDNASSIGGGAQVVVQDDNNFAAERGLSSFDIRHQFRSFYVWELPFGERKRWARTGWQASWLGNWSVNGNTTISTGTPFTARVLGSASNNSGTGNNFSERADQIGDPSLPRDLRTPLHFFNTAAFVLPPAGRFGTASRNTIPGPGTVMFNFSAGKNIRLGKDGQRRLDLRWEVQNLLNTPNFTGLTTVVNSSNYGRVQGSRPMRQMDFQARFNF